MTFRPDPKPEPRKKAKRKRIPYRSEKRIEQEDEYKLLREQYLKDHPICEACHNRHSDQIHHIAGRIENLLTDVKYFMAVCAYCHEYIELNPIESKKKKWSLSRLSQ